MSIILCIVALTGCSPGHGGRAVVVPPARGGQSVREKPPVRLLKRFSAWVCIHSHEAAWDDAGDPYWGGLQMDQSFMKTYGRDMIAKYGGWANVWPPGEQIRVAERAYVSGRGFYPWPNTARMCGLI